jgi:hypothetical protein
MAGSILKIDIASVTSNLMGPSWLKKPWDHHQVTFPILSELSYFDVGSKFSKSMFAKSVLDQFLLWMITSVATSKSSKKPVLTSI